ncbi:MAG: DUF904 domain-containing protein [Oxalobacter sp.]|jgi:uncharacterized protein (TIGR02449 family)|nr:MAG: DUF904 domain-containing protein [Oxalobacter sp.]
MDTDFSALSEKVSRLADLTRQLRRENADLRLRVAALTSENTEMSQKLQLARQKVGALMTRYPATTTGEEHV